MYDCMWDGDEINCIPLIHRHDICVLSKYILPVYWACFFKSAVQAVLWGVLCDVCFRYRVDRGPILPRGLGVCRLGSNICTRPALCLY